MKKKIKELKSVEELVVDLKHASDDSTLPAEDEVNLVNEAGMDEEGESDIRYDEMTSLEAQVAANKLLIIQLLNNEVVVGEQLDVLNKFMTIMNKYIPQQVDTQPLRMKTYTVMPGDTMAKISKKLFGQSGYAGRITSLNKLQSADDIEPGMVLNLPVI